MERSSLAPFELVALAVLGALLVAGGGLLVVAGIAGLLFGDGWASGSLAEMPGVLARLLDHASDPRDAWPAAEAARLPGAAGFYASGLLVLAAVSYLALHVVRV